MKMKLAVSRETIGVSNFSYACVSVCTSIFSLLCCANTVRILFACCVPMMRIITYDLLYHVCGLYAI